MEKVGVGEVSKVQNANQNLCGGPWVHSGERRKPWRRMEVGKGEGYSHGSRQRGGGKHNRRGPGEEEAEAKTQLLS